MMETIFKAMFFGAVAFLALALVFRVAVVSQIPPGRCEEYFGLYWQNPNAEPHLCVVGGTVENEKGKKFPLRITVSQ